MKALAQWLAFVGILFTIFGAAATLGGATVWAYTVALGDLDGTPAGAVALGLALLGTGACAIVVAFMCALSEGAAAS